MKQQEDAELLADYMVNFANFFSLFFNFTIRLSLFKNSLKYQKNSALKLAYF